MGFRKLRLCRNTDDRIFYPPKTSVMSFYKRPEWIEFSKAVIESDGSKCVACGRSQPDAVLQVHHKKYFPGRMPWEYGTQHCETLCKRCHAAEHGKVQPGVGWNYLGSDDLGGLYGTCENYGCGSAIRYTYLVYHQAWGYLTVGTVCCDNLTDTYIASNNREAEIRFRQRETRFIFSNRWKFKGFEYRIRQSLFDVKIKVYENWYQLTIHGLKSKIEYPTLHSAKSAAFSAIESGDLYEYLKRHRIKGPKRK